MKLLVIVLCLLSERYLIHTGSLQRFKWFAIYGQYMEKRLSKTAFLAFPWFLLALAVLPMLLGVFLVLYIFANGLFGLIGLLLNIFIFYCCIGPNNPFYPTRMSTQEQANNVEIGRYLAEVNGQLFALVVWYIFLGPLGALTYRLISLSRSQAVVSAQASLLTNILDWIPARITAFLYLLVGNFQPGLSFLLKLFFTNPENNHVLLSACGMQSLGSSEEGPQLAIANAERLVEHAVIALLMFLACFTLIAWV